MILNWYLPEFELNRTHSVGAWRRGPGRPPRCPGWRWRRCGRPYGTTGAPARGAALWAAAPPARPVRTGASPGRTPRSRDGRPSPCRRGPWEIFKCESGNRSKRIKYQFKKTINKRWRCEKVKNKNQWGNGTKHVEILHSVSKIQNTHGKIMSKKWSKESNAKLFLKMSKMQIHTVKKSLKR